MNTETPMLPIRVPFWCPGCEQIQMLPMTVAYARDLLSCLTAAVTDMPPLDGRLMGERHDG